MPDYENLTPTAARYVKQWVDVAMRECVNGDLTKTFQTLAKLQLDCIRVMAPRNTVTDNPRSLFEQRNRPE